MSKKETGKQDSQKTPNGIKYEFELAGKTGARYFLMPEQGISKKDIAEAKSYIKANFDAVQITVESGIYKKQKGQIE
jgi:hypothetical protein